MATAPGIDIARCLICNKTVIKKEKILVPYYEFAFGIHPEEKRQWPNQILPFAKWECRVCNNSHSALRKLISFMGQVLPFRVANLDMPDYIDWLGHWITATKKFPEFGIIFNVQMAKRQFHDILSLSVNIFPELTPLLKNASI